MKLKTKVTILFYFLCLVSFGHQPLYGGNTTNKSTSILDKDEWKKLADKTDYTEHYKTPKDSQKSNKEIVQPKKKRTFTGIGTVRIILTIVIIGALVIVLYIILNKLLNFFDERVPTDELKDIVENLEENIHQADFETLLANALANKEFKLAIRILYLRTVKRLADKEIIKWKKEKTNGQYVREIESASLSQRFSFLTIAYENSWFGNCQVNETKYKILSKHYNDFINHLN